MKNSENHKFEEKLLINEVIKIEEEKAVKIIEEAKRQAEEIIKNAHIQSQNIIEEAHKDGQLQAQLLIEKSIIEIQKEAEELRKKD
jgi:vacuolar-type H+-ATPase subunit H